MKAISDLRGLAGGFAVWTRPIAFVLASACLTGLIFLLVRFYVLELPPIAVVDARSMFVTYEVQRERVSSFVVHDAQVTDRALFCDGLLDENGQFTGLVSPREGTHVSYTRHFSHLQIMLDVPEGKAGPVLSIDGRPDCEVIGEKLVLLVRENRLALHQPFPIMGRGEIGVELGVPLAPDPSAGLARIGDGKDAFIVKRSPGPLLLGATVRLFGRTATLYGTGQLYPISGAEFHVPLGSRLASDVPSSSLAGYVRVMEGDEAMDVEVTLEAAELKLYRVGPREQAETLASGAVARAFGNPGLAPFLIAVAIFSFIVQILCALDGVIPERRRRK